MAWPVVDSPMPNGLVEVATAPGRSCRSWAVVAAVQRDVVDLLAGDHATDVAGLGFDLAGHRRDRNGLGEGAHFELEVGGSPRGGVQHDLDALHRFEAGELHAQGVGAGRQADEHVRAGGVGDARLDEPGLLARRRHGRPRQCCRGGVGDASRELRDVGLRPARRGRQQQGGEGQQRAGDRDGESSGGARPPSTSLHRSSCRRVHPAPRMLSCGD
jgi:hypothetical protein